MGLLALITLETESVFKAGCDGALGLLESCPALQVTPEQTVAHQERSVLLTVRCGSLVWGKRPGSPDGPAVLLGKLPSTPEVSQGQGETDPRERLLGEEKVAGEGERKVEVGDRSYLVEPT